MKPLTQRYKNNGKPDLPECPIDLLFWRLRLDQEADKPWLRDLPLACTSRETR